MDAIWSKVTSFSDQQRCQRLQACQDITLCVQNCLQRQRVALLQASDKNNIKTTNSTEDDEPIQLLDIENCVSGVRMMKYFHWRESDAHDNPSSTSSAAAATVLAVGGITPGEQSPIIFAKEDIDGKAQLSYPNAKDSQCTSQQNHQTSASTIPIAIPTCAREVHAQWGCRAVSLACSSHLISLRACFEEIGKEEVLSVPYFGYATTGLDSDNKRIPCRELQQSLGKCVAERAAELEQRVSVHRNRQEAGNDVDKE